MSIDRWLAFTIWVMGIVLVILVVVCVEIYIQRSGSAQQSQDKATDHDALTAVKRQ